MNVAIPLQLPVHVIHNVTRYRESKALASARLRQDECIDTYDATVNIHKRPSAVTGIDRCVRLDVHVRIVRVQLPCDRTDDAHG